MGRASREKGVRGELEVAAILRGAGFTEAHRTAQHCGKSGDAADVTGIPGYHLEVKRCEHAKVDEWAAQAERDSSQTGAVPVVVYRKSKEPWRVILPLADFIRLVRKPG